MKMKVSLKYYLQSIMEETRNLKTAVIGVGSLGQHHARNYAELSAEGRGEFVGVCDVNEENARVIAEKNGCDYFTDWRELLDKTDAVSIVTPTETHCEIACAFLENGVHVLHDEAGVFEKKQEGKIVDETDEQPDSATAVERAKRHQ